MRKRIKTNIIAFSDPKRIKIIEATSILISRQKYVQVFGKLIPITEEEAIVFNSLNIIEI